LKASIYGRPQTPRKRGFFYSIENNAFTDSTTAQHEQNRSYQLKSVSAELKGAQHFPAVPLISDRSG